MRESLGEEGLDTMIFKYYRTGRFMYSSGVDPGLWKGGGGGGGAQATSCEAAENFAA